METKMKGWLYRPFSSYIADGKPYFAVTRRLLDLYHGLRIGTTNSASIQGNYVAVISVWDDFCSAISKEASDFFGKDVEYFADLDRGNKQLFVDKDGIAYLYLYDHRDGICLGTHIEDELMKLACLYLPN